MKLKCLCDHTQYVDTVVKWIYTEFIEGIRPGISYQMLENNFKQRKKKTMPISIIAVHNEACMGVASLVENDLKGKEYTPWLAGLYVDKQYRNKGIGKVLIEEIKSIAHRLGYETLYLRTEHASEYYKNLNWMFVEKVIDEFGLETSVFLIRLRSF